MIVAADLLRESLCTSPTTLSTTATTNHSPLPEPAGGEDGKGGELSCGDSGATLSSLIQAMHHLVTTATAATTATAQAESWGDEHIISSTSQSHGVVDVAHKAESEREGGSGQDPEHDEKHQELIAKINDNIAKALINISKLGKMNVCRAFFSLVCSATG